jgi:hypothetical protein
MAIDRDHRLAIPVKTYSHYSECEPWCLANVGAWNEDWWRDFPDIMASVITQGPHEDCYWFHNERDALMFRLKFV